ncbi:hypothetical protein CSOJ01_13510 [Colletotrichum sojae]|uniref:Uncharacterized protein n=1 Tax=Colletotrichum sojae TaxID=2175907 RepID=A0A8H6MKG7_9PEZI|nr:hypothetical protein CSOJ01_13510 [Colletotrichum sojae]
MVLMVSAAAFVPIVVILCKLDGEVQPDLPYDLNVNTLIAIFSAMLRATLLFVIAEVVGQSRWLWLESPRPLSDLERSHDAGQGAWWSISFLFCRWKPWILCTRSTPRYKNIKYKIITIVIDERQKQNNNNANLQTPRCLQVSTVPAVT